MTVPAAVSDRLMAEIFGRPTSHAALQWLCDHVGGRTSGAGSGARAEQWGADQFAAAGPDRVWTEAFPVPVWERGPIDAVVEGDAGWRLTAVAHGFAPVAADVRAPVVDLGHGDRPDYDGRAMQVLGRIVLCDEGVADGRRKLHRTEKLAIALENGAAGFMMLSSASGGLPRTGVCHRSGSPIASVGVSQEDGERLRRLIASGAEPCARITMSNRSADGEAANVLAELRGADPGDEVVLAGGHLDSWDIAQGATDNGLGVAIVLEAARALAALGRRPQRTLRFALWAAEETGLRGSKDYAARHIDQLDALAAVMNFDMTGDPSGYWTPGRPEPSRVLRGLVEQLAPLGMRAEFSSQPGLHSDHQPFMLAGVPVVCLSGSLPGQGGHYYHSVGDTFEKVSQAALCRAACVAAHTLWALADAPERNYARLTPQEVDAMVEAGGFREALAVE